MADDARRPPVPRERWVEFAATRDERLRDELVTEHIGLARRLAHRFANRGEPYDDLVQVGSIALIKAVDRFDPDRGVEFTTYATGTVIGELKRHFRDKGWAVRAPRRIQELYLELGHTIDALSQELGRPPTVAELADSIGVSQDAILEAIEAGQGYRSSSIDAPGQRDETLADRLGSDDAGVAVVDERSVLAPALASLPERQQEVVRLRFIEGLTQSEIASRVGISQMHVSRLLAQSLARIRENLAEEH
ncbi:MAG: SigB/SigF/SigG family RNA polymerase sigma factor [Acidimicrobiales bacterium]|jgi:RNA polymerase sigma-B factor